MILTENDAFETQNLLSKVYLNAKTMVAKENWDSLGRLVARLRQRIDDMVAPSVSVLDEKVAKLYAEKYVGLDAEIAERDRLFRAMIDNGDYIFHTYWSLQTDEYKRIHPEPPLGRYDKDAYDNWLESNKSQKLKKLESQMDKAYEKLDNIFDEYKRQTWGQKPIQIIRQGHKETLKFD